MDNYYGDKYGLDDYSESKKDKTSKRKNTKRRKNKNNNKKSIVILTLVLAVILVSIAGVMFINYLNRPFTFSENVTISGIEIQGLSYNDALNKIKENSMSAVYDYEIIVEAKSASKCYTKEDFTYNFDYDKALKEAKTYSLKEQGKYDGKDKDFTPLENPDFNLEYAVDKKSIEKNVVKLAKEVDKQPTDAQVKEFVPFADERFIYREEQDGYVLVQDDLTDRINSFFSSGETEATIEALVNVYEPNVTVKDLKENIVGLSQATSVSYNTANGNTNMKVSLEACNGSVIEPGEIWSFNDCTGDSNLEKNGYKSATVISGQKLAQGIGGGLCQSSSTIFKAAIFANMSIYERHNHFWASAYAYPGEDATIDYPNLDLKLRNPTDYQMFMECKMEGNVLTVNIYGYQDPSYDNIKIYSKNHDVKKGKSYKTTTYRVLYLDGKIVKEETLCNSTYSLTDGVAVKKADEGSFRVMVDGTHQTETEPPTTKPTEKKTEPTKKKKSKKKSTNPTTPDATETTEANETEVATTVTESTNSVETTE